jgi:pimeloyl-ACP methyl ester carboxylesterase
MPNNKPDFSTLYEHVNSKIRDSLASFRENHPPRRFTWDGKTWQYVKLGQGKMTALFLPGAAGAYDIWWQQLTALSNHLQLISISYPPIMGLQGMASGIEALLEHVRVDTFHVIGSSMGGYLAQVVASRNPERIRRAVFGNSFVPHMPVLRTIPLLRLMTSLLPLPALLLIFRWVSQLRLTPAGGGDPLLGAYLKEVSYDGLTKDDMRARFSCITEPFDPLPPDRQRFPILIIESDNDPLVRPQIRRALRELYPHANVINLERSGHFLPLNQGHAYASILHEFLLEE